jgi:N-acetylneuraminate synthase
MFQFLPASPADTNLLTIPHMRDLFNCLVGLSDHTLGLGVALASIPLGAVVIEKHFTLSRATEEWMPPSLGTAGNAALVAESERAWLALGGIAYGQGC